MDKEFIVLLIALVLIIFSSIAINIANKNGIMNHSDVQYDCYGKCINDDKSRYTGKIIEMSYEDGYKVIVVDSKNYKLHLLLNDETSINNPINDKKTTLEDLNVGDEVEVIPEEEDNMVYPGYFRCVQVNIIPNEQTEIE